MGLTVKYPKGNSVKTFCQCLSFIFPADPAVCQNKKRNSSQASDRKNDPGCRNIPNPHDHTDPKDSGITDPHDPVFPVIRFHIRYLFFFDFRSGPEPHGLLTPPCIDPNAGKQKSARYCDHKPYYDLHTGTSTVSCFCRCSQATFTFFPIPFVFRNFLYTVSFFFGTLITAFARIPLNAFAPTFFEVSLLVRIFMVFSFLSP